jgi:hypothetical protein
MTLPVELSIQDEFRRKSLTKHRYKKLLGRRKPQYFKEKGPVNVRVASLGDTVAVMLSV